MSTRVITLPVWEAGKIVLKPGREVVSTVSRADNWSRGLSPFFLGPVNLYDGYVAKNVENAWQYSKVYSEHVTLEYKTKGPSPSVRYWKWAMDGWASLEAHRYPMGKGRKPEFSWWDGYRLTYVEARKVIYGPLYAEAVQKTDAWKKLVKLHKTCKELILLDFDVRDTRLTGEDMTDVLNNPHKKMGHAFVLKMLLDGDDALEQMDLRG